VIESPGIFWTILFFLAAIGPLIFLHELGHYVMGRWCGVKADTFSIGFGREIWGRTDSRGTRWKLGWMPLGGYVKFAGDMSAASTPDLEWQSLPESERAFVFQAKPVWKRALIVLAGPIANFLVAVVIYMGLFAAIGEMAAPPIAAVVSPNSAAAKAGFLPGDRVTAINGHKIERFTDMISYVALRPNQLMTVDLVRDGAPKSITVAPDEYELVSRFGTKTSIGRLGFAAPRAEPVPVALLDLPGAAIRQVARVVGSMTDGLGQIIMGYHSVKELGGPMMIAKMSGEMASLGLIAFVDFMALISINLGFINLLPVPMLDGGHLFFYGLEALRRKPVALHVQEWAYRTGFFLLMAFVTINDLGRFGLLKKLGGLIG
jgi:regulator of sigma E protease